MSKQQKIQAKSQNYMCFKATQSHYYLKPRFDYFGNQKAWILHQK